MNTDARIKFDRLLQRLGHVRLMNDTKWREVFGVLADLRCRFFIEFVGEPTRDEPARTLSGPIRHHDICERWIGAAPIAGGPCEYRYIQSVTVPKSLPVLGNRRGETQDLDELHRRLSELGQLPLQITRDELKLVAYA
jgi:hypothetical protein